MRTNVDLDDDLVTKAMDVLGVTTKRAAIEAALHRVVDNDARRKGLEELWGMGWHDDLDAMRGPHADELPENKAYFEKHKEQLERDKAFFGQ